MTVATTLRWWRRRRGLTQAELARRARTTQAVISRIESGQRLPLRTLQRIAAVLGVPLRNLIRREAP